MLYQKNILNIVGLHALSCLAKPAVDAICAAEKVYGGKRHLGILQSMGFSINDWQEWRSPISESLQQIHDDLHQGRRVTVVASGDPMCYGIGSTIVKKFPEYPIQSWPAPSSFSLTANALNWPMDECVCMSLHHGSSDLIRPYLFGAKWLLCLTKNQHTPKQVAKILCEHNLGNIPVYILENLLCENQNIRKLTALDIYRQDIEFSTLNTIAIDLSQENFSTEISPIFHQDEEIEHDGLLTKFCYRSITLSTLNPRKNAILWDIGAGSGSISIAWHKLGGYSYAVESEKTRQETIQKNAKKLLGYPIKLLSTTAEKALTELDSSPQAIFMGGALHLIDQYAKKLLSGGTLVANAVTLNSQKILIDRQQNAGGKIRKISIDENDFIGPHSALKPSRAVLQYYWKKP